MKKVWKYLIVFIVFILIMILIFLYFTYKRENIKIINNGKELLNEISDLNEGKYNLKDGLVYSSTGSLIKSKYLFGGNGDINIDKYGNVSFDILYKNRHICKYSVGKVSVNNKCIQKELKLEMSKNNDIVSFMSNYDNLYYKISTKDDFIGEWIKSDSKNIVISSYSSKDNYIWFKDENGILSDVYTFYVDCLNTNSSEYDSNTFYCLGSKVKLDNKEWIVLNSKSDLTTLMLSDSLIDRLYMCTKEESDYCFYTNELTRSYRWSLSYVNYYLNNEFINELSDKTKSLLIDNYICDNYNDSGCDDSGCGGYLKETIKRKQYTCDNYTTSKVRIISYEELNLLFNSLKNTKDILGNYWILNTYGKDVASTIELKGNVFILEKPTNKKEVRPVITLSK